MLEDAIDRSMAMAAGMCVTKDFKSWWFRASAASALVKPERPRGASSGMAASYKCGESIRAVRSASQL